LEIGQFQRKYQVLLFFLIPLALSQWLRLGKMMTSRHKCADRFCQQHFSQLIAVKVLRFKDLGV
jgi:hypothetical protein